MTSTLFQLSSVLVLLLMLLLRHVGPTEATTPSNPTNYYDFYHQNQFHHHRQLSSEEQQQQEEEDSSSSLPSSHSNHPHHQLNQCSIEIENVQSCVIKDSCSKLALEDCVMLVAKTTTDKTSLEEIGSVAQDCIVNHYLTSTGKDCPLADDDNCLVDTLPTAIECIVLNIIDECLYETQIEFLECTSANSNCNYYDCHSLKYWDDPKGYESLNQIIDRANNDFVAIDICPAIDHSWVQPLCHITEECCDTCTQQIDPLLNCMVDNIVMKSISGQEDIDHNHCFGEISDDVCNDYLDNDNTNTEDADRRRRNLKEEPKLTVSDEGIRNLLGLGLGSGSSKSIKTDLDLNSTTTTEYLQYCGRKFALNIALRGSPSLAINEHMICLLEVAASKTFVDDKVSSVAPYVRKSDEPYWINGILWSAFIIGIVMVVGIIGLGMLLHESVSAIKQTLSYRRNKKRYRKVGGGNNNNFGDNNRVMCNADYYHDDDDEEGEEGHFFESPSSPHGKNIIELPEHQDQGIATNNDDVRNYYSNNLWNNNSTVRRGEDEHQQQPAAASYSKTPNGGGGGGGNDNSEREPIRLSALL